jgi:hypothetical protein
MIPVALLGLLSGCSTPTKINFLRPQDGTTLYCGHVRPGCEDVETNTLEIRFKSSNAIELIRQFHGSDLPITSGFLGERNASRGPEPQ